MSLLNTFASNLTRLRAKRKMTQLDLANSAGLSVSYISMLQRGVRSPPLETLEQLAKALGVRPADLLKAA